MSDTEETFLLLVESLNREKELTRLLNQQQILNDSLQLQVEMERRKTEVRVDLTSSSDEFEKNDLSLKSENPEMNLGLKETFGTNSSVLMQYKYDELRQSYSKCVKKLGKKSKQLKKVLQEAELLKFKNCQLVNESTELNKKIEQVCFRFFGLMDRRSEEQMKLNDQIKELKLKLMKTTRSRSKFELN